MVLLANDTDTPNNCVKAVKVIPWPNRYIVRPICQSGVTGFECKCFVSFFCKIEYDFQYQIKCFLF